MIELIKAIIEFCVEAWWFVLCCIIGAYLGWKVAKSWGDEWRVKNHQETFSIIQFDDRKHWRQGAGSLSADGKESVPDWVKEPSQRSVDGL